MKVCEILPHKVRRFYKQTHKKQIAQLSVIPDPFLRADAAVRREGRSAGFKRFVAGCKRQKFTQIKEVPMCRLVLADCSQPSHVDALHTPYILW